MQVNQRVLYPPQVPEEIPGIKGEPQPIHDTVPRMKDERPGMNDGRQRKQEGQAEPPAKAGGEQPARHCLEGPPGARSRSSLCQFTVEHVLRSDTPGSNMACIIASPKLPGIAFEGLPEVAPGEAGDGPGVAMLDVRALSARGPGASRAATELAIR